MFALANAGIVINGDFLTSAFGSAITLGIVVGYVVGKPVGIFGTTWLVSRLSRERLRPPIGWAAVAGGGTIAGIGFTVALLVATLAFDGAQLEEAKLGILTAGLAASVLTWLLFRATRLLPRRLRILALLGTAETLIDLYVDVDPERDHLRGPVDAPVTVVEYGDFECPYCGMAEPVVRELLSGFATDVRYVWRHLPLTDVHANAQLAAEAAEAAADQGAFWEMHDLLLDAPGCARAGRPRPPCRASWASTSSGSRTRFAGTRRPFASRRTSTAPTSAASRERRPSSSTAGATTAPTTSRPCRRPCAPPARGRS